MGLLALHGVVKSDLNTPYRVKRSNLLPCIRQKEHSGLSSRCNQKLKFSSWLKYLYRVSAKKVLGFDLVAKFMNPKTRESLFMCTVLPMLQVDVYSIAVQR